MWSTEQVLVPCSAAAAHHTHVCMADISSPPRYDESVSFASPYISRIPKGILHSQEDESCVFKPGNRSST